LGASGGVLALRGSTVGFCVAKALGATVNAISRSLSSACGVTSLTICGPGSVASGMPTIAFQPSAVRLIGARYLP